MTNQDRVRIRYPNASIEQESSGEWTVWDISRDKQKQLHKKHWPQTFTRGLFGFGRTEEEAWVDAVQKIKQREGLDVFERLMVTK